MLITPHSGPTNQLFVFFFCFSHSFRFQLFGDQFLSSRRRLLRSIRQKLDGRNSSENILMTAICHFHQLLTYFHNQSIVYIIHSVWNKENFQKWTTKFPPRPVDGSGLEKCLEGLGDCCCCLFDLFRFCLHLLLNGSRRGVQRHKCGCLIPPHRSVGDEMIRINDGMEARVISICNAYCSRMVGLEGNEPDLFWWMNEKEKRRTLCFKRKSQAHSIFIWLNGIIRLALVANDTHRIR